jgi:hypothetical protein
MFRLLPWIDKKKLSSYSLSRNPNSIDFFLNEENHDKLRWDEFERTNTNAIFLKNKIEKKYGKNFKFKNCPLEWQDLYNNFWESVPNKNEREYWTILSLSGSEMMDILKDNQDKINWPVFSSNPDIFELDYEALKERCAKYKNELVEIALHPSRIENYFGHGSPSQVLDKYI